MSAANFRNIAVIGAGTMGAGIAAQIANAGFDVLLLDLDAKDQNTKTPAAAALDRLLTSEPPQLMHKRYVKRITSGTIDKDFYKLAECDWIIEAVVERLDVKKALYKRLGYIIDAECIVSSNTSTIPIHLLVEGMPVSFRERFAITHYFNPVRYMRLLELVSGEETNKKVVSKLADFNDRHLGKGVVRCADTPGFLGNRVGVFALQVGIDEAINCGLSIEDADALMGRPMGIPKTGVFGLYDLIGIDLMADVVKSLGSILPSDDAFHAVAKENSVITLMIKNGFTKTFSGGVEAAASSGGQIMPPVMGIAAFVLAALSTVPYSEVIIAAFIPAVAYFFSLFLMVIFECRRMDIKAINNLTEEQKLTREDYKNLIMIAGPILVMLILLLSSKINL